VAAAVASSSGRSTVEVLGFEIDTVDRVAVKAWTRASLDADVGCRQVVTLNPEYVMAAERNPAFAAALKRAELVTADGVGITAAAKLIHGQHLERITGVDLVEWIAEMRVAPAFLLGAADGVAVAAAAGLTQRFPGFQVAGAWAAGSPDPRDDRETIDRIRESGAKIVLVAYGAVGQVMWIDRNQPALADAGVRLALGIGGAFDYLSGAKSRAPEFVRQIGAEWLVRLITEPWRWRRQLVLPVFAWRVVRETIAMRLGIGRRE
jgi:N-acetylglucosaminyldiphosphoundecaprenol N-acetyl-beta-D-mannosaminyltransferase